MKSSTVDYGVLAPAPRALASTKEGAEDPNPAPISIFLRIYLS